MKRLYFIRHGLSEHNLTDLMSGGSDTPLVPKGHQQAKLAGKKAKQQGLSFDTIVSSPRQRAHHTARHIADALNYPHDQIVVSDLFRERHFGSLEGLARTEIAEDYAADESAIDYLPGVEPLGELQQRANRALAYLQGLDSHTVLVVAHGTFGRALYRAVNKLPVTTRNISYNNCEIIRFL